jgi:hypothetical protein
VYDAKTDFVKKKQKKICRVKKYHKNRLRQCVTSMPARLKSRLKQQHLGIKANKKYTAFTYNTIDL